MTEVSSLDIARAVAERFGLTIAEATDGRAVSLLFTGEKANLATFREVLGHLVAAHDGHQFAPNISVPGVYARGFTPSNAFESIYLVVVGDPEASQYVLMRPVTRDDS